MNRSRFRSILIALTALLLAGWCYIVVSPGDTPRPKDVAPADTEPVDIIALTPTPAFLGFDAVCEAPAYQDVRVEGFLHVPDSIGCVRGENGETCTVQLIDLLTRGQILVSLPVGGDRDRPVLNHMVQLPIPYDTADFMVPTKGGRWAGEGSIVRLTGQVESYDDSTCKLVGISQIEKLDEFTLVDGQARRATLRAAVQEGWVEITITGDGLSRIDLRIEPKVSFNLNLEIESGTMFLADSAGVQNMVVRKQSFVYVTPRQEAEVELEVSCANMGKKEPRRDDTFTVLPDLAPQDLIQLITWAEFAFEPMRIQQFAVWTITDNPPQDGYVGITASFSSEGSGPTPGEMDRIRELFLLSGLDAANYNALQEQ